MLPKLLPLLAFFLLLQGCKSIWPFSKPEVTVQGPQLQTPANQPIVVTMPPAAPVTDIAKLESSRVSYKKADFTLSVKADAQLNRFQNNAHTLFMCIYQLKDPNGFNQLAEDKEGLPKLLECNRFDGSVANAKRVVVQPGQVLKETRDRAEGARFIGIATGYYGTGTQKVTELAPLSVVNGDFSGNTIDIDLGAYEIEKVTVK